MAESCHNLAYLIECQGKVKESKSLYRKDVEGLHSLVPKEPKAYYAGVLIAS